jgi:uncharacterized protein (TIGR01777 family)
LRVAVFGASGFIGRHLTSALRSRGDDVIELSLRDPRAAARVAADCDGAVNLAGETLGQRWNADVKKRILESRTALPSAFFDELSTLQHRIKTYVSASAVGYYGTSETQTFTEESPRGTDFLAQVCEQWESIAQRGRAYEMRVACIRAGLVLGTDGGALARLLPIFKAGTGGRVGSGKQWYSWVHIDDTIALYLLALDRIEGAMNATAPNPLRNEDFTEALARALHRPAALPAPPFMLKMMLGEGATLVLDGQRVLPQRALSEGYAFKYPTLEAALADLIH